MKLDYSQALELINQEKYQDALSILNDFLERDSTFADAYYQRAKIEEKLENFDNAIADYTQVIYLKPSAQVYLNIALIYFSQNKLAEVVKNTKLAINLNPDSPISYRLLANVYQQQKQISAAIDAFKKATSCYLNKQDKKNARYCFEQIEILQQQNPQYLKKNCQVTKGYLKTAIAKTEAGNYHAALSDLNWLLNIEPDNAEALCKRGLISAQLGETKTAIQDFATAIQIEPQEKKWQYHRGIVRSNLGDNYGALEDFSELLKQDKTNVDYLLQRGNANVKLNEYDAAFKDYANALAIDSQNGNLHLATGELQEILENHKDALKAYQKAAMFFLNQGDYQKHQKAQSKINEIRLAISEKEQTDQEIIIIPVKYYNHDRGSAVVEAVLNNKYTFEFIVDTGATRSLITSKMQNILKLATIDQRWCIVADGRTVKLDVCHLDSLAVQKATLHNLNVFITEEKHLNQGLLGQDFLSDYEVHILKNEIHLYPFGN